MMVSRAGWCLWEIPPQNKQRLGGRKGGAARSCSENPERVTRDYYALDCVISNLFTRFCVSMSEFEKGLWSSANFFNFCIDHVMSIFQNAK